MGIYQRQPEQEGSGHNYVPLLEKLLEESFAQQNHFGELSLEEIGKAIEEARDSFESGDDGSSGSASEKASFERCTEIYCTLLLMLEDKPGVLFETRLRDLLLSPSEETRVLRVPSQPTPEPAMDTDSSSLFFVDASPREMTPAEMPGTNNLWGEPGTMTGAEDASRFSTHEQNQEAGEAAPSWEMEESGSPIPGGTNSLEWSLYPASSSQSEPGEAPPDALTNASAQEYWGVAAFLKALRDQGSWPLPAVHATKLIAQSLCSSLEAECAHRLSPAVMLLWSHREVAIRPLLEQGNRKLELHPSLRNSLERLSAEHPEWLFEGKFSLSAVITSLRYILAAQQPHKLHPSLMEAGVLIFFFGQSEPLEDFPLENLVGATGLNRLETTELMFRLTRLHRLRSKAVAVAMDFAEADLKTLEQDLSAVLDLLRRLHFEGDSPVTAA